MKSLNAVLDAIIVAIALIPTATWSTLTGVLVGGAITFLMQRLNFRHLRKLAEKDKRKRDMAVAISILLKAVKMFSSSIAHIKRQLDNAQALAAQHKITGTPPWQIMQPIVGKTPDIVFTDDERTFIVTEMPKDFVTVLEMPDIHNDLTALVQMYATARIELGAMLPARVISGSFTTTDLTPDELARATPRMLNLQSLVEPMMSRSKQDQAQAITVFNAVKALCVSKFPAETPNLAIDIVSYAAAA
jgi:hypothetical protein